MPPFRLTAPEPLERDIHKACAKALDTLLLPPAQWAAYPAGAAQLSRQQAARHSEIGLKRGYPDLMIFYQKVWGVEIKRTHNSYLSKTRVVRTRSGAPRLLIGQEEMFRLLVETGAWGGIAVVRSVDELIRQLIQWQIPIRSLAGAAGAGVSSTPDHRRTQTQSQSHKQ